MTRYKLTIEYDGAPYMGWQRQKNQPTVQGRIEQAAEAIDGRPVIIFGAGRTDSGVHALAQVAHIDLEKGFCADKVRDALNFHLAGDPIAIVNAELATPDFNARFDAKSRDYLYRIVERRPKLALEQGRVWRIPVSLDINAMHRAAQALIGKHDFSTFRDRQCQARSPVKTLDELTVLRAGEDIRIIARAPSFLHRQVRSIVGTLAEVGMHKIGRQDVKNALNARDRKRCGPVAPADGLYLVAVSY